MRRAMMIEEKGPKQIKFFIWLVITVFSLLIGRLAYLQVARGDTLSVAAESNRLRLVRITAPRGIIYDRNQEPLAVNRLAYSLIIVPDALVEPERELARVADLLGQPAEEIRNKLDKSNYRPYEGVTIVANLDSEATLRLAEAEQELPGVMLQEMPVRYYPKGEFAAHVLGYLGEITAEQLAAQKDLGYRMGQIVGREGIERVYDRHLQGVDGGRLVEVDRLGIPRRTVGDREPIPGNGLVLTIDAELQAAAETALAEELKSLREDGLAPSARAGAVVAMDPNTGEILALTSRPGYDPNLFVGGISAADYRGLVEDPAHPFTNRVISGEYPPGSTFKVITGLAALSEGLAGPDDQFFCDGYDPVYPKKRCWTTGQAGREGHGVQDIVAGYKNSCNIVFYELGRRVGPDVLADYSRLLGLGRPTGIDFPGERPGLVPDTDWKRRVFNDRWYFPETMDFAIGQGFLTATPLQLAQVYMALVNNGIFYRPHLVRAELDEKGRVQRCIKPEVMGRVELDQKAMDLVKQGLSAVTDPEGTAYSAFAGMPVKVAGKTGTAQNSQGPSHGWFIGMAPAENPRIVVLVLVEHGTSGSLAAAPIARKVLDVMFPPPPEADEIAVPSVGEADAD